MSNRFKLIVATAALVFLVAVSAAAPEQEHSPTLDQRYAPNPGLRANLVFRVLLAIVGTALCWVPFRTLWSSGDIAALVLIADVALMNLITVVNSLLWNSDDWDTWWDGTGLCDIEVYLWTPLQTIYAASIFAIIRQLAQQVKLARNTQNTRRDRVKRALIQAAIIFPIPIFQLLFTWFDLAQRYNIGTLIGCMVVLDNSWPRIVVYEVPSPVFVAASIPYAYLTWKRYRAISKTTREVLNSSTNSAASLRVDRTRLRLYNMSLSIMIVYLPVSIYLLVFNIQSAQASTYLPYSYTRIHWEASELPWDAILFKPSWLIPSPVMNQPWFAIATTAVIVAFFGTTQDALGMYRRFAIALGFGRFFPRLRKQYDGGEAPRRAPDQDDTQRSWIELDNVDNRKNRGNAATNGRPKQPDPYPIPYSAEPSPSLYPPTSPLRSPLGAETRRLTPPPEQLGFPYGFSVSSPLDRIPILPLIPPRTSSRQRPPKPQPKPQHAQQQKPKQPYAPALNGPARALPRISEAPYPSLTKHDRYSARINRGSSYLSTSPAADLGRSLTSRFVARSDTSDAAVPMLPPSLPSPPLPSPGALTVGSRAADSIDSSEPDHAVRGQRSQDVVQPRELLGEGGNWAQAPPSATTSAPAPATTTRVVNWPFMAGTAITTAAPSPVPTEQSSLRNPDGSFRIPKKGERPLPLPNILEVSRGKGRVVPRTVMAQVEQSVVLETGEETTPGKDKGKGKEKEHE
ncbi:pheromone A receptor-domain-containing protein [Hypoxylon sp. NC1633]|nr:pheromone A receptor-domain-containing protein [Hypoxylon sp. NC1633]